MKLGLNTKPSVHCIGSSLAVKRAVMGLDQVCIKKVPAFCDFAGTFFAAISREPKRRQNNNLAGAQAARYIFSRILMECST